MERLPQDDAVHVLVAVQPTLIKGENYQEYLYVIQLRAAWKNQIELLKLSCSWSMSCRVDPRFERQQKDQVLLEAIGSLFKDFKWAITNS